MNSLNDDVAESLGGNRDILPYLPELLSDLKELGGSADLIVDILKSLPLKYSPETTCLDLGCGKGLISISIAKNLGISVLGIDGMPEFVEEANNEKSKNNLSHLCRFEYGDIKDKILTLKNYNIVILSAVGHLWGTFSNTLYNLKKCVKKNGFVIIDDGYTVNGSSNEHLYITRNDALQQITQNNFEVLNEIVLSDEEVKNTNKYNTSLITGRAEILKKKFPDKAKLFDDYIAHQQRETEIFGTKIKCVVWVLKNK